jgi:hypothetical protein
MKEPPLKLMRDCGETMVAGVNAQMRKLLRAGIVPAKQLKAQESDKIVQVLIESAYKRGENE